MTNLKIREELLNDVKAKMQALDVLTKAKAILHKRPWFGGDGIDEPKAVCALMAINEAAGHGAWNDSYDLEPAAGLVLEEVNRVYKNKAYPSIRAWNDDYDTTKRKVTGVFRRVSNKLKASLPAFALSRK